MNNVTELTHPLIQHKISRLRDKNTTTNEFRALVEEIAMLMGFEALKDLPLEDVEVETPIETCMTPMIAGKNIAIVPLNQQLKSVISVFTEMKKHMNHTNTTANCQAQSLNV